jgi:hypothetical protein
MKSHAILLPFTRGCVSSLCPVYAFGISYSPISHLVAVIVWIRSVPPPKADVLKAWSPADGTVEG